MADKLWLKPTSEQANCFLAYAVLAASSPTLRSPLPRSMDAAADSVASEELAQADSMEITTEDDLEQEPTIVAGAMEMTSESFVPYSLLPESKPSLCVRCGTTHDDNDETRANV